MSTSTLSAPSEAITRVRLPIKTRAFPPTCRDIRIVSAHMKALFLIIFCLSFDSPLHRCGEHLEGSVMTESSVLHSPGFEMRLSIWEACHTSWVKSKVTGCSKDWASDANCLCTLQRLELPELKVYRMFEKSAEQKSSHRLTTIIACTIYISLNKLAQPGLIRLWAF